MSQFPYVIIKQEHAWLKRSYMYRISRDDWAWYLDEENYQMLSEDPIAFRSILDTFYNDAVSHRDGTARDLSGI